MIHTASGTISDMQPLRRPAVAVTAPIVAATIAVAGAVLAAWARAGGTGGPLAAVSLPATIVLIAAAGCVLALARPDNCVGSIMVAAATAWGVGEGMFDLAVRGIVAAPGTVPGADWLAIGGSAVRAVGWGAAAVAVPAFFPDGHLPGPRWRWLGWTLGGSLVATFFGVALDPHAQNFELQASGWHSPLHLPGAAASLANLLGTLSLPLTAATVVGSVTGMVSRWRRGGTALRRQLLTFAIAAALPVIVIPTAFGSGWPTWLFAASTLPLPIAIAAAILTGGVFDLATVANRSLVWGALAASIVAIYALIIMGVGVMLNATDARWLPWLGTAVVAVSFAPLRTALAQAADRVTYGQWRQPYAVLAGLSPRIAAASSADLLLADVVTELHYTLGLREAALRDATGAVVAGSVLAGGNGHSHTVVPLMAYGERAGDLLYTEPATPLRPADRRVLEDLAAQLALLLHARALTEDVRRARERLVLAREEERRRLRRDLHDGLGPALAGLMLKVENAWALVPTEPEAAVEDLHAIRDDIQAAVADVRRLVEGLRPPAVDDLGLGPAVRQAVLGLATPAGIGADVDVADPLPDVPAAVEVALYRIISEAVTNVVRRSGAASCRVAILVRDAAIVAEVSDDGGGFSAAETGGPHSDGRLPGDGAVRCAGPAGGYGLISMRERAEELGGSLAIRSNSSGTTITATLPLPGIGAMAPALTVPGLESGAAG
jgi:signal transduction histidine kinase